MIYTLFFSRLRDLSPDELEDYEARVGALREMAESEHPGFVGMKTYVAEDGDRLTVVRFRDEESQRAWKVVPEHHEEQVRARTHYYERFQIVVCDELRSQAYVREGGGEEGE